MTIHTGDCIDVMRGMADASIDAIVTDPPYGLGDTQPDRAAAALRAWLAGDVYEATGGGFMGKDWDAFVPGPEVWRECLRVLKPGGHLLAFAGTRTQHLMATAIHIAGFEIRDLVSYLYSRDAAMQRLVETLTREQVALLQAALGGDSMCGYLYGSGFPKSLDVSKALDAAAGAEREVVGQDTKARITSGKSALPTVGGETVYETWNITAPATDAARQWAGWGTALKPAIEPVTLARKPLVGTVAANVAAYGTGALNVDGCRVGTEVVGWGGARGGSDDPTQSQGRSYRLGEGAARPVAGRWPANVCHDGSAEVLAEFPETGPAKANVVSDNRAAPFYSAGADRSSGVSGRRDPANSYNDNGGSAARFFYCSKASQADRDAGCERFEKRDAGSLCGSADGSLNGGKIPQRHNVHPTVKPTALMRWLCRLITPPGGLILDPFAGSGSTGKAAALEGFAFIGIERDAEYAAIARARIAHVTRQRGMF